MAFFSGNEIKSKEKNISFYRFFFPAGPRGQAFKGDTSI